MDRIDLATDYGRPKVDDVRAFDIERAFGSSAVQVTNWRRPYPYPLTTSGLFDLLAGSGIMRPERYPGRGKALICLRAGVLGEKSRS
jgi:hypothetical protein